MADNSTPSRLTLIFPPSRHYERRTPEFDVPPELVGAPYGSDMRLLVHEAETPAILYGPGDIRQAHATDEWIAVEEVVQRLAS